MFRARAESVTLSRGVLFCRKEMNKVGGMYFLVAADILGAVPVGDLWEMPLE